MSSLAEADSDACSVQAQRGIAQRVPTVFGNAVRVWRLRVIAVCRGEGLRRCAKNFFELATEMGFAGELQLSCGGLVRVTLRDELLGDATLEVTQPTAGGTMQVLTE